MGMMSLFLHVETMRKGRKQHGNHLIEEIKSFQNFSWIENWTVIKEVTGFQRLVMFSRAEMGTTPVSTLGLTE